MVLYQLIVRESLLQNGEATPFVVSVSGLSSSSRASTKELGRENQSSLVTTGSHMRHGWMPEGRRLAFESDALTADTFQRGGSGMTGADPSARPAMSSSSLSAVGSFEMNSQTLYTACWRFSTGCGGASKSNGSLARNCCASALILAHSKQSSSAGKRTTPLIEDARVCLDFLSCSDAGGGVEI